MDAAFCDAAYIIGLSEGGSREERLGKAVLVETREGEEEEDTTEDEDEMGARAVGAAKDWLPVAVF